MFSVAPLTAARTVVSDAALAPEFAALLRQSGVEVLLA
jgi:DeoR/GlpR family transcriptional regulator of sugar metabolism